MAAPPVPSPRWARRGSVVILAGPLLAQKQFQRARPRTNQHSPGRAGACRTVSTPFWSQPSPDLGRIFARYRSTGTRYTCPMGVTELFFSPGARDVMQAVWAVTVHSEKALGRLWYSQHQTRSSYVTYQSPSPRCLDLISPSQKVDIFAAGLYFVPARSFGQTILGTSTLLFTSTNSSKTSRFSSLFLHTITTTSQFDWVCVENVKIKRVLVQIQHKSTSRF